MTWWNCLVNDPSEGFLALDKFGSDKSTRTILPVRSHDNSTRDFNESES